MCFVCLLFFPFIFQSFSVWISFNNNILFTCLYVIFCAVMYNKDIFILRAGINILQDTLCERIFSLYRNLYHESVNKSVFFFHVYILIEKGFSSKKEHFFF